MNIKAMKFLRDIQRAGSLVAQFTAGKSRADYQDDVLLRSGVERQLVIIGEALTQALHLEPEIGERVTEARRIVAFRNVLIHSYSTVNDATVWETIQTRLPRLMGEVECLLNRPNTEES